MIEMNKGIILNFKPCSLLTFVKSVLTVNELIKKKNKNLIKRSVFKTPASIKDILMQKQ